MAKTVRRWLKRGILIFLGLHLIVSVVWALAKYSRSGPDFIGSPPSKYYPRQRNDLDLKHHGRWWGKFGKQFRPSGYWDIGPAGAFTPIVHHLSGWDVFQNDLCVEGTVASLGISDDDGDIGFTLDLPPPYEKYAWRPKDPFDGSLKKRLIVEIDEPIRKNFPIAYDLAMGDLVRVCGRWVYDRGHSHCEIHPARWVEILQEGPAPPP